MQGYIRKALREAKVHSSWINPNQPYEEAVDRFIAATLHPSPENRFLPKFTAFVDRIKVSGMWNSLSQTLLKIASPGVPDFYQGSEIWNFSLVDPDNRRPVDYALRRQLLNGLRRNQAPGAPALIEQVLENPAEGAIKMYVTTRALCFRKSNRDLLEKGSYIPLRAAGDRQNHVIAFARNSGRRSMIAVAGRFFMALGADRVRPIGEETWGDSALMLRRDLGFSAWREIFSERIIETDRRNDRYVLPLAKVFADLPVALLYSVE
jgi:(1->4)-alpha-D-glucan 1-alpha-D-glucosylmutase